jgi:hypothetical protein
MTTFTLERSESQYLPAARCTFNAYTSESGTQWVDVTMLHFYDSTGWTGTMGRGDGTYTIKHAREFYRSLLEKGFIAA